MGLKESHLLVKALFPVDIQATEASYEIQFSHVKRPAHFNTSWDQACFEVSHHKWLDLSEEGYGLRSSTTASSAPAYTLGDRPHTAQERHHAQP